tara:strand:+ start:54 stop:236 length:183 start_codon:yes stop_codon:yes gene_type:complete
MTYEDKTDDKDKDRRYIIVSALDLSVLQSKVNSKIEQGFLPKLGISYGNGRWAQIMTRDD